VWRKRMKKYKMNKLMFYATNSILENIHYLTELDSVIGDGDHGVTMSKIAYKIQAYCELMEGDKPLSKILEDLSWELMNINGGSAGPLWGAYFEGMATGASIEFQSEDACMKNIFIEGYKNFKLVSGALVGDKTMMDAIFPATMILQNEAETFDILADKMALAAIQGAEDTKNMIAKFGRARSINERSIGHKDPGAVSFSLFYKGIAEGLHAK